jgi:hypothetical protein
MRFSTISFCSLLLAAAVLAAGAGDAQAQRRDSFSELRASLNDLFSPPRRTRRAKSKQTAPTSEAAKPSASPKAESSKPGSPKPADAGRGSAERPAAAAASEKSVRRERENGRRPAKPAAAVPERQAAAPRDTRRDIGGATPPPPTKRAFGDPPKTSASATDRSVVQAPGGREQAKEPGGRIATLPPPGKRDGVEQDKEKAQAAESEAPEPPPPPSACQQRFAAGEGNAVAAIQPRISVGQCVVDDVVRLEAVTGHDGRRIAIAPAATLRCPMAEALVQWVREDVAPVAREVGAELKAVSADTSFECRSRNHVKGAKLSEHGHANAVDLRGIALTDGTVLRFTDPTADRDAREALRRTACARFTTVLGPGSDGYHEDHIHLDLAQRRSGYRLCQWDVRDPTVAVIPMPPERPSSAPPRTARARN